MLHAARSSHNVGLLHACCVTRVSKGQAQIESLATWKDRRAVALQLKVHLLQGPQGPYGTQGVRHAH